MTIDEGISDLEAYIATGGKGDYHDYCPAIKLGIEALKREKVYRPTRRLRAFDLLPGETAE